ncbi:zinc-binding dehydrogenase [Sphingobium sp. RAC03]|uniref:zinc-binding dehydrogenase n=1 Tax=Sphingobium sp. RAC03 TaxID=1843368 RepID=UPI00083D7833|nr:zinc-binding dehydrogenase [Sphingobium sp. RAC03]AOF95231.1 zinc-binding dehydrogenase family protein [Sphingobium sp. RAC03]
MIGFPAGIQKIPANLVLLKACQIVGVFWGAFTQRDPQRNRANNDALFGLWQAGTIDPHISARYGLENGPRAIADLAERRAVGTIVVELP